MTTILTGPAALQSLEGALEQFFASRPTFSVKTRQLYRTTVRHFCRFLERSNERELSRDVLFRYREFLGNHGGRGAGATLAPVTQATYLALLKAFLEWLTETGSVPASEIRRLTIPHAPARISSRGLTEMERRQLLASLSQVEDGLVPLRNAVLLRVIISTGLGPSEVAQVRVQDLTWFSDQRVLLQWPRKGAVGSQRILLNADVVVPLREYLRQRGQGGGPQPTAPLFADHSPGSRRRVMAQPLSPARITVILRDALHRAGFQGPTLNVRSLRRTALPACGDLRGMIFKRTPYSLLTTGVERSANA